LYACHETRHLEKFRAVTPNVYKVIGATINFWPIFKLRLLKIVGDPRFRLSVG